VPLLFQREVTTREYTHLHDHRGYVEIIDHSRNGYLLNTQEEAFEVLLRLKVDRALRESVGRPDGR
jgi:hypothetical protein